MDKKDKEVVSQAETMSEEKDPELDHDIPDRSHGDLYCRPCDAHMNSELMWIAHIQGKRHLKCAKKGEQVESKFEIIDEFPLIQKDIDELDTVLVGLDHLCEIRRLEQGPTYNCFLCSSNIPSKAQLLEHITGVKHLMAYMKQHMPIEYDLIKKMEMSKANLPSVVQEHIVKEHKRVGTGKMQVKRERPDYEEPLAKIFKKETAGASRSGVESDYRLSRGSDSGREKRSLDVGSSRFPRRDDRFESWERVSSRIGPEQERNRNGRNDFDREERYREREHDRDRRREREEYEREARRREMERQREISDYRREKERHERYHARLIEDDSFHARTVIMDDSSTYLGRMDPMSYLPSTTSVYEDSRPADLRGKLEKRKEQVRSITMVPSSASSASAFGNILDTILKMPLNALIPIFLLKLDSVRNDSELEEEYLEKVIAKCNTLLTEKRNKQASEIAAPLLMEKFKQSMAQSRIQPPKLDQSSNINQLIMEYKNQHSQNSHTTSHRFHEASAVGNLSKTVNKPTHHRDKPWDGLPTTNQFTYAPDSTPIPGLTLTEQHSSYPHPLFLSPPDTRKGICEKFNVNRYDGKSYKR